MYDIICIFVISNNFQVYLQFFMKFGINIMA
jgi:hypothetical protein